MRSDISQAILLAVLDINKYEVSVILCLFPVFAFHTYFTVRVVSGPVMVAIPSVASHARSSAMCSLSVAFTDSVSATLDTSSGFIQTF